MTLSYLPLCHVAERVFTVWFNAAVGVQVNFAESIDTVQQNLREVQPTILFGVPRIWEKVLAGVTIRMANATPLKRANHRLWMAVAGRIGRTLVRTGGVHTPATRALSAVGSVFLYRALRDRLGLRLVRYAASGAAPIAPDVLEFFMGIGVPMHEVYGMTENSAVATANRPGRIRLGTVGEPHPGVELRIDDATGEILTRHLGTFAGYWNNPAATAGPWTPTAGCTPATSASGSTAPTCASRTGSRTSSSPRAARTSRRRRSRTRCKASPFIKEAVVIGDRRNYLTALIGIELDTVADWAQRRRIAYTTYRDLSERPEVVALVQAEVDRVNERFAKVEAIRRFRMLPKELDHEDGELTATQKVKRAAIQGMFADLVDDMYARAA